MFDMVRSDKIRLGTEARNEAGLLPPISLLGLLCLVFLSCVSPLLVIGAATPQSQARPNRIIPVPHPLTSLLRAEQVHKELSLSPTQIEDVQKAADKVDLPLWRLRDLPASERNEGTAPLVQRLTDRLSAILSASQMKRLTQIAWQAQGIEAVLEPEIVAGLGISPEQLDNIGAALNTARDRFTSLQMSTEIRPESRRLAYVRNLRTEAERNILAALNVRQRRVFSTLMGHPFDLSRVREIACQAPEFEAKTWLNSPPLKMADLKGKVTVIHFYAFGCGNCIRNLPHYNDWHKRFGPGVLQIVGIHRPETQREHDVEKVKEKAAEAGMDYPVAIDNESLCWNSWANHTWPSIYLLDRNGFVRYWWYGELNWRGAESEQLLRTRIEELVAERS